MENFKKLFAKELENLKIANTDIITEKYVSTKFKREALKVHSDKTGKSDDADFKQLLSDYNRVMEARTKIQQIFPKMIFISSLNITLLSKSSRKVGQFLWKNNELMCGCKNCEKDFLTQKQFGRNF